MDCLLIVIWREKYEQIVMIESGFDNLQQRLKARVF